jgi:hypothetical protein
MKRLAIFMVLYAVSARAIGQIRFDKDTLVERQIKIILTKYKEKYIHSKNQKAYKDLRAKSSVILAKIDFIDAVVDDSYYGGEKSGSERKNELIQPVLSNNLFINTIVDADPITDIGKTSEKFGEIDSLLNDFYLHYIKNKFKNITITGDDDENKLIEVQVKVLETFAGKKELPGFEVFCETPFIKNSREDFNPTPNARRLLEAGVRMFHIKRGRFTQKRLGRIVYGDPDTHTVLFSNEKSTYLK